VGSNRQTKKPVNRQTTRPSANRANNLDSKRERFEKSGRFPLQKVIIYVSVVAVIALVGMAGWSKVQASKQVSSGVQVSSQTTGSSASSPSGPSAGGTVAMAPVNLTVSGANASFAVADVQKSTLVGMKYARKAPVSGEWQSITGGKIPLISYIAPSGNLVVATSFCEPCKSTSFHIEGNTLVCDTCFTKWDLNTLQGVSGGCTAYPPQALKAQKEGGNIVVATADLENWAPRP
jgi:Membrane iron-sulfur containing protein FtrD-like